MIIGDWTRYPFSTTLELLEKGWVDIVFVVNIGAWLIEVWEIICLETGRTIFICYNSNLFLIVKSYLLFKYIIINH
jgi:hypothetical protein